MKIVHNLTGVVLEVTKQAPNTIYTKVVANPNNNPMFKIGQPVKVSPKLVGITYTPQPEF